MSTHNNIPDMEDKEKYIDYSVHDFICDEFFQDWVLHPGAHHETFWHSWLQANEAKRQVVEDARLLLMNLGFKTDKPEPGKAEESLAKTLGMITAMERQTPRWKRLQQVWRVAAFFIILVGAGIFIYLFFTTGRITNQVSTTFGQLDTMLLPDQSMVVLNANSTIRYNQNQDKNKPRELWLQGEALFDIRHLDTDNRIEPYERFLVHAGNTTVEVLGTRFNIRQRRQKIEIALINGSIVVHFDDKSGSDILMKPGDLVIIDTSNTITKTTTNTGNYSAWTKKRLVLNNPTLKEIIDYLEDVYGKKFVLADPRLALKKVEGPILLDSLDDALFVLSTVLNVSIIKENDSLIIRPR